MKFKTIERDLEEFFELDNRYISIIPKPYHDVATELAYFLKGLLQCRKQPSWLKVCRLLEEIQDEKWRLCKILVGNLERQLNKEKKKEKKHEKKDK